MMYQKIANHPSVKTSYQEQLILLGVTSQTECDEIEKKYRSTIENGDSVAHNLATQPNASMWFDWTPYINQTGDAEIESRFNQDRFKELAQIAFTPPKDFVLQRQVEKFLPIDFKWQMKKSQ